VVVVRIDSQGSSADLLVSSWHMPETSNIRVLDSRFCRDDSLIRDIVGFQSAPVQ